MVSISEAELMVPCILPPSATQEKLLQRFEPKESRPGFLSWNDPGPRRKVRSASSDTPPLAVDISQVRIQKPEAPAASLAPAACGDGAAARAEDNRSIKSIGRTPSKEAHFTQDGRESRFQLGMLGEANSHALR